MDSLDRRSFTQASIGSLLTYSLFTSLFEAEAWGDEIKPIAADFLKEMNELSQEVKGHRISQVEWQKKCEGFMDRVQVNDFMKFIDFEKLTRNLKPRKKGERSLSVQFPEVEGLPTGLVFGRQLFALHKGRSVVPHGHYNMATSFLILGGEFHGRHYDRLEDADDHLIVKPTIDDTFKKGQYSTISDHKDNVHWFRCNSESGFIFNIHVLNIDPKIKKSGRVYIDPAGEKLSGGRIRAPKMKATEAHHKYG
ncbi:MAG: hypothetical protein VX768_14630 [Planctomycetota bacterium]|nr:hypothetical protein [Planctomycetota bacterium]